MRRWKEDFKHVDGKKLTVSFVDHGHNIEVCSGKLKGHMFAHESRAREAIREVEEVQ
jgi:hypothetical protein